MSTARVLQIRTGEGRESAPGIRVWTASGERMTQNYVELQPGATTSVDRHANEQINYLLRGCLEVCLGPGGGTRQELAPGETVIIPPHVEHQFRVVGDLAAAMIAFLSPARNAQSRQHPDSPDPIDRRGRCSTCSGGPHDMVDDQGLRALLDELAELGRQNDARETERGKRLLNITPETGQFLAILVKSMRARQILEIGTSNGYSTIWLAWAARETGGHVTTIERAADKVAMAHRNLERAGLSDRVTVRQGAALDLLTYLSGPFDMIFLDADRPNYLAYLDPLATLLRRGGLLVTDNVTSHAHEMEEFLLRLRADPAFETVTVPLGNGQELTYKR